MYTDGTYYRKTDKPFDKDAVMKKIRQYATEDVAASFDGQDKKVLKRVYALIESAEVSYSNLPNNGDARVELGIIVAAAHKALCKTKTVLNTASIIPP